MSDLRRLTAVSLLLLAPFALGACTGNLRTDARVNELHTFDTFPIWWLGEEYQGEQLSDVIENDTSVSFLYGSCQPSRDGGCAPPYQVVVERCEPAMPTPVTLKGEPEVFRGAAYQEFVDSGHARLLTDDVMITLFIAAPSKVRDAAAELRSLNLTPAIEHGALMPPPRACVR